MKPIIIIGTGLAGYSLGRELRRLNSEQPLVFITADDGSSYSKPMLSNALAQGKDAQALVIADAEKMRTSLDATIMTGTRVEQIDAKGRRLYAAGEWHEYGSLVMATGAKPIHIPYAGEGADDLISVNSLSDYAVYRERLGKAERVAIIGPGLIGCEFANDLLSQGKRVSVIGPDAYPISTLLPQEVGHSLQAALREQGVDWYLGTVVETINRVDSGYLLALKDGGQVVADLVISAVGLVPDTHLATETGLDTNRGIRVDSSLKSSLPGIYALGDCAEVDGVNLPFVMPLMLGAKALAKTLAGEVTTVSYPIMPVVIKTPACPVVAVPPPREVEGAWEIDKNSGGVKALFRSVDKGLIGFALCGSEVEQKAELLKLM
ncbi:MAG: FAD-dependent oxidoreductase [Candidatus Sedimenticola sp. (ex Thyasira tokunagai)]